MAFGRIGRIVRFELLALAAILFVPAALGRADDPPPAEPPPAKPPDEDPPPADPPPAGMDDAPAGVNPDEEPSPTLAESINKAIQKGVAWLITHPQTDGSWGNLAGVGKDYNGGSHGYDTPVGPTALAIYTLLKCGTPTSEPVVKKGFAWLRKHLTPTCDAYEFSMALLAVTATADPFKRAKDTSAAGDKVRITGDWRKWATELKDGVLKMRGPAGWRYWGSRDKTAGGPQDLSSTQLAALALLAAERCGISVDPSVWTGILQFARAQQEDDGQERPRAVSPKEALSPGQAPGAAGDTPNDKARGFAYILGKATDSREKVPTGGMTACGIASVMMSRFVLANRFPKVWKGIDAPAVQRSVYDGLAWLDLHWSPITNPPKEVRPDYDLYYLYCLERAMDLIGGWRLGSHLWYIEMTESLLPLQQPAGFWDTKTTIANGKVLDTCFALLFLHRATRGGIPFPSVTGGSDIPPSEGH